MSPGPSRRPRAGRLLASGRESDIFEHGPGLVVRRSRLGRSMRSEALTMEYARTHGYPVPAVAEVSDDGTELVMERIDGPSMIDVVGRRPWTTARHARVLSDLHRRLHDLPSPEWLPAAPVGTGDRLLHLDLHPLNVLMTRGGPMVIDWSTAASGDPVVDVAMTWVLMASGEVPAGRIQAAVVDRLRTRFLKRFLAEFELDQVRHRLREVVEWKAGDENMTDGERQAMRALVETDH